MLIFLIEPLEAIGIFQFCGHKQLRLVSILHPSELSVKTNTYPSEEMLLNRVSTSCFGLPERENCPPTVAILAIIITF